jgi:hypothetical protein
MALKPEPKSEMECTEGDWGFILDDGNPQGANKKKCSGETIVHLYHQWHKDDDMRHVVSFTLTRGIQLRALLEQLGDE